MNALKKCMFKEINEEKKISKTSILLYANYTCIDGVAMEIQAEA